MPVRSASTSLATRSARTILTGGTANGTGAQPVQEERATAQDEGARAAGVRQQRSLAGSARHAEQLSARLVELLLPRNTSSGIPRCRLLRPRRARACIPRQTGNKVVQGAAKSTQFPFDVLHRERGVLWVLNACRNVPRRVPHGEASRKEAMGRAAEVVAPSSSIRTDGGCPVAQVNDLSRNLMAFDPISTSVVVVEMSARRAGW